MPDPNFCCSSSTQLRHANSLSDFVIASRSEYVEEEVMQDSESSGFILIDASESKSMQMPYEVFAVDDNLAVHDVVVLNFATP